MKILVLSQYWYPENGVHQRRWSWLSKLSVEAGHEVTVICPVPYHERKTSFWSWLCSVKDFRNTHETGPSGETIIRSGHMPGGQSITAKAFNQGGVALAMLKEAFSQKMQRNFVRPNLIIGTVPSVPTALITPIIARVFGVPYVIDLRDPWPDLFSEGRSWNSGNGKVSVRQRILSLGPLQLMSIAVSWLMYRSFKSAAGIMFTSKRHESELLDREELRGIPLKTAVIRNVFPPKSRALRTKHIDEGKRELNVLYAGTLGRAQNLNNVLDALKIAREKGTLISIRLVGAGVNSSELRKRIKEENLPAKVLGRVPAEELLAHYSWADTALVHLTDWKPLELAVPSKIYELMSNKIHITGVLRGEAAELIERLNCGHVVEPENPDALADYWERLIEDRSQLAVSDESSIWVEEQRNEVVPKVFMSFLNELGTND